MQLTPEIKQQLEQQKAQCIFCKLIAREYPSKIVFEDSKMLAILDINPAVKGHTLYFPKEHYPIIAYIPEDDFQHYFGLLPALSEAIKQGTASTGINIFIANGAIAGQTSPHCTIHLLPREHGDGFFHFFFNPRERTSQQDKEILAHNIPLMMAGHFQRNQASWHTGTGETPAFLKGIYANSTVLYEDEKVVITLPANALVSGHIQIFSKTEERFMEKLSPDDAVYLFHAASFAATAVFEGLKAQGTNIIIKSGPSEDNPSGLLSAHVLPRRTNDELDGLLWKPKQPKYKLDTVQKRINEHTWRVGQTPVKKPALQARIIDSKKDEKDQKEDNEIARAIERIRG